MSRVVRFHSTGGPEVLQIDTLDVPAPAAGEVRISVKAIGLNRAEAMYRSGAYLEEAHLPSGIGYEASGIVEAVGPGVSQFKVGDKVSTIPAFSMNQYGAYSDLMLAPVHAVAQLPENLSWEEGASIWMQYLTAWGALVDIAQLRAGEFVLIPAASSSVGLAAIQVCHAIGAIPIALTRTSKKVQELKDLGATHVIATEEQDLVAETQRISNGKGARVVFDPVGGPTVARLTSAMANGGILFLYGALSTDATPLPLFEVLSKTLTIRGYLLFEFTSSPERVVKGIEFILNGLKTGALKPIVAKVFPFEEIVASHQYLESNQQIGKVVVKVAD
ncbi:zinc-dependent alcohol dehydrogenase family protein [Planctomicrobium sp. SH668]|uniref:zinc-dependent alcohol dehydrogenase family protein n=1 Tax=Planctomicrobium sp. SH668 TaxID=3448126 RepID=UPI003F5B0F21